MNKAYKVINDRIIKIASENPDLTWNKLFTSKKPRNAFTQREYNGVNWLLLYVDSTKNNNTNGEYATFKQIKDNGGRVKKGSKASLVMFWGSSEYKTKVINKETKKEELVDKKGLFLKFYNVFAVTDIEGIDWSKFKKETVNNQILSCEDIINNYKNKPVIEHNNLLKSACYIPSEDIIRVPELTSYVNSNAYYQALFHEVIHSTGHSKRLKRTLTGKHAEANYAREELIAEMGSAYLLSQANVEVNVVNSAAYIKSWLQPLNNDYTLLVGAFSKADKAVKYILNVK